MKKFKPVFFVLYLILVGCQPSGYTISTRTDQQQTLYETNATMKVGVDKKGTLKQQIVHVYKTKRLKENKFIVRAGTELTILESVDGSSLVHFFSKAWTLDYKTEISQSEAIGWISTSEIVYIQNIGNNDQQDNVADHQGGAALAD